MGNRTGRRSDAAGSQSHVLSCRPRRGGRPAAVERGGRVVVRHGYTEQRLVDGSYWRGVAGRRSGTEPGRGRRRRPGDVQVLASESEEVRIAVVHGPNLNLLGTREPAVYGRMTLAELDESLRSEASALGVELESHQANGEGELIDYIQEAAGRVAGFVVNAGGYTHTSVALLDALVGVDRPYVEVHLTNVAGRESFRHRSLLSPKAAG